jgi:membrane protease YdiL (CAAX protease family)
VPSVSTRPLPAGGAAGAAAARGALLVAAAFALRFALAHGPEAPLGVPSPLVYLGVLAGLAAVFRAGFGGAAPGREPPRGSAARLAACGLLVLAPAALAYGYAVLVAGPHLDLVSSFDAPLRVGPANVAPVAYLAAVPLVEEYYYRQLLHREFTVLFGRAPLFVVANAVWFAAVHDPASIPVAFVVGLCCAALRTLTGRLALPVLAHALANLALDLAGIAR